MAEKILIVEDEKKLNTMLVDYLSTIGFETGSANDGREAVQKSRSFDPDLIVLDLMLPGMDGLDVIRKIREFSSTPVIMLTARAEESDKLIGLELGADDYITKPFSMRELAARIRAVLRRTAMQKNPARPVKHLDLVLDPQKRTLARAGTPVQLTSVQFDIVTTFLRNPGRVYTRQEILEAVQDIAFDGYERTIDVHIKNIRKALEPDPGNPRYLLTVWGVGYKLADGEITP